MSKIKVNTANQRMKTAPNLYGIFLEDINRAVDGGLYPELLRNRSFEDSILPVECTSIQDGYAFESVSGWRDEFNGGEGLSKWVREGNVPKTEIPGWYVNSATMELDREDTLNKNRQVSLKVDFEAGGQLRNIGFCGIPQVENEEYRLYLFARAKEPVELAIAMEENGTGFPCGTLTIASDEFTYYELDYKAQAYMEKGCLLLQTAKEAQIKLGFISLMPRDTYKNHGLRRDIVEKLAAMHPKFFRFPGGCIVEGFTISTAMRFHDVIGPVWERKGHQLMWHYRSYDAVGFHEYLQLCEDLDMEPLYVCNCGMTCQARMEVLMEGELQDEMLQDTLDAIEYAIGAPDTKWGALRASMGHPEPFKLNYIEIGNENWGPAYEERYQRWYQTLTEKYPHLICIANSHLEEKGLPAPIVDEHYYDTAEYFAENTHFYDDYDRKGPKIFIGEVAVVRGFTAQLYGALAEAAYFTGVEKNQDVVTMVSYAPLLENVHYQSWFPNLIRFDGHHSAGIPSYYVWKMFGNNRGDYVVEDETTTGRIKRPVKGVLSIHGKPGMKCSYPVWNDKPLELTHELMGHLQIDGDIVTILPPDEEQKKESKRYYGAKLDDAFLIFGEEKAQAGTFTMKVFVEAGQEIELGVFPYRLPEQTYVADETNPPKPWNVENTRPFLWKLSKERSEVLDTMGGGPKPLSMEIKEGTHFAEDGWHTITWKTDLDQMQFFVDDKLIHELDIPSFPVVSTVATVTEDEVLLKVVNIAESDEPVEITLDCDVADEYQVSLLTGDKTQMNTLEEPEAVSDRELSLKGAGKQFTYLAPKLSVSIIKLQKTK